MGKRIAVTGATGFIGKHLTASLLDQGHDVIKIARHMPAVECDIIYHLACPSTTQFINSHPIEIIDIIIDGTRKALSICETADFVFASSIGAGYLEIDSSPQLNYNSAKFLMEQYLKHTGRPCTIYRLPSVYGPGMSNDSFVKRCIDGNAFKPLDPEQAHYIAHVEYVAEQMSKLKTVEAESTTLGDIYEEFSSGRRGLYRTTSNT